MSVYLFLTVIALLIYFQVMVIFLFTMPRSKVNRAFVASTFSFAWFSFFLLILQGQDEVSRLYYFDRFAVFGWATFPVFLTMLFYFLARESRRIFRILVFFLLLPASLAVIGRYLYDPQSIKIFFRIGEIWYFSVNMSSPWVYLFPVYLLLCGALSFAFVYKWFVSVRTNKEKLQVRVVFLSLLVFFFFSLLTNIILPFGSRQDLPPMAHFNFIPLIVGLFFSLTSLRFKPFNREALSRLVSKNLEAFVVYLGPEGRVVGANQFAMQRLGYAPSILSALRAKDLIRKLGDEVVDLVSSVGDTIPVRASIIPVNRTGFGQKGMVFVGLDCRTEIEYREQIGLAQLETSRLSDNSKRLKLLVKQRQKELSGISEQMGFGRRESRRISGLNNRELKEKELLIQEIHHRVKNNMQMVISLLNMLKSHPDIPATAAENLAGIADRVRYISAIHEDLYSTPNLSRINFGSFLHKATGELNGQIRPGRKILFNLNVSGEQLPVVLALPCGLVFHELLQNALKHAFPNEGSQVGQPSAALVNIEFFRDDDTYTLVVSDNGIGIPEDGLAGKHAGAMGLHLVRVLVREHLKGEVEIKRSFGTTARVRFGRQET